MLKSGTCSQYSVYVRVRVWSRLIYFEPNLKKVHNYEIELYNCMHIYTGRLTLIYIYSYIKFVTVYYLILNACVHACAHYNSTVGMNNNIATYSIMLVNRSWSCIYSSMKR